MAEQGKCRSCGTAILWVMLTSGKRVPLNPDPHADGNVVVMPGGAMVIGGDLLEQGKKIGSKRYQSHFATCTSPEKHRKPR